MCGYRGCCWASICSHGSIMFPLMELHLTLMDPTVLFEQTTESTPEKLDSRTNRLPVNDFSVRLFVNAIFFRTRERQEFHLTVLLELSNFFFKTSSRADRKSEKIYPAKENDSDVQLGGHRLLSDGGTSRCDGLSIKGSRCFATHRNRWQIFEVAVSHCSLHCSSPLKSPVELDPKALSLLRVEETYSLQEPLSTME
ncbi:hypothetical protein CEXT_571201 [Caerostris extrusa]|uniref:Uncharacterized protein n=1 Tax=Caerostris extrusa TaxID=172846 RepID=A0AAV4NEH1_CAEEX|nr:hypothetical protein CEXT_571201 [Caerostris extrusa]